MDPPCATPARPDQKIPLEGSYPLEFLMNFYIISSCACSIDTAFQLHNSGSERGHYL